MGFRIRKSISLGKGLRLNLGKSGVTSVTMGKRGAPHVTVGKGGTRFGTPIIPGTGISYETRLDKPSKKARRKNTTMGSQKEPAYTPSTFPTPTQQLPTTSEQPMEILAPTYEVSKTHNRQKHRIEFRLERIALSVLHTDRAVEESS